MLSSDKNIETIGKLVEALKRYLELQKEYVKFDVIDKLVKLVTAFALFVIVFVLVIAVLFYLSFAAVYWLEPLLGTAGGFAVVALFFLVLLVVVLSHRKAWIERPLIRLLTQILVNE